MRKFYLLLLFLLGTVLSAGAQHLYPFSSNGKWGYKNVDDKVVVDAIYNSASRTIDGYGIVSKTIGGKVKYGVIDEKGAIVIDLLYDYIDLCNEGYVAVYSGAMDELSFTHGKWSLYSLDGTKVSEDYYALGPVINGVAWANSQQMSVKRRIRRMPIVDKKGKEQGFERVFAVSKKFKMNELFQVELDQDPDYSGNWFLINTQGEKISNEYDKVGAFVGGLAWVSRNGKYGFINIKGEEVIPVKYKMVEGAPNAPATALRFNSENLQVRWVANHAGELAWIDENGKIVVDFTSTNGKLPIGRKVSEKMWDF